MTVRSVQEARNLQETHKPDYSAIAREGILDILRNQATFHSDDLEPLGIPDEHRNVIGSQTAKLVNQRWIEEIDRRKSRLPSRNAAKSGVYQLTLLGRMKVVAGVGAGTSPVVLPQGPREQGKAGRSPAASVDPSEDPPRLFDLEPPKPRSAVTDSEAA